MDVQSLLQKLIAHEIIIRQNEQLFLLVAHCANSQDSELLAEMRSSTANWLQALALG
jgi:hypothetical protein